MEKPILNNTEIEMTTKYKCLPSEPTEEMIKAGIAVAQHESFVRNFYKQMWKAAPEVEQEPIATCKIFPLQPDRYQREFLIAWKNNQPVECDLYTHPQPKREPLSEDFVIDLILKYGDQPLDFMDFVKEIEKAHG
jgi:hypothetical protein